MYIKMYSLFYFGYQNIEHKDLGNFFNLYDTLFQTEKKHMKEMLG